MRRALALAAALCAGPAGAQDEVAVWTLSLEGEAAYLVYGVPDSDDGRIALSCRKGSGRVTVMAPVTHRVESRLDPSGRWLDARERPSPWPVAVSLRSGSARAELRGQAQPDEMNGGSTVEATLAAGSPVLLAFSRSGRLSLTAYGETVDEPPAPAGRASAFLKACG